MVHKAVIMLTNERQDMTTDRGSREDSREWWIKFNTNYMSMYQLQEVNVISGNLESRFNSRQKSRRSRPGNTRRIHVRWRVAQSFCMRVASYLMNRNPSLPWSRAGCRGGNRTLIYLYEQGRSG